MLQVWCNKRGVVTGAEFSSSMVAASTEWSAQWSRYPIMDIVLAGLRQGIYCDKHRNIVKYIISEMPFCFLFKIPFHCCKIFSPCPRSQARIREFGLQHVIDENDIENHDANNLALFDEFINNLNSIGFRQDIGIIVIFKITVSIILLFKIQQSSKCEIELILTSVANNLEVNPQMLYRSLTETNINSKESFSREITFQENVKSLARILYTTLVDWTENFINAQLKLR